MKKNVSEKAKEGVFWTVIFQGVQFVIRFGGSILLARVLFPEDFGLMTGAMLVVQFSRRIVNFGFNLALVQRKEISREHLDTVFLFNGAIFLFINLVLFLGAPYIARFLEDDRVAPIIAAISFIFFFRAFIAVPKSILSREMKFKELQLGRSVGRITTEILPLPLALLGFGVWSLVFGVLGGVFLEVVVTSYYARYFPRLRFHFQALKDVFSFGIWTSVDNFINYFVNKVDYFLIIKFLDAAQLGFYERAFNLMNMPRNQIARNLNQVLFSAYSRIQDDDKRVARAITRVTSYIAFLSYPIIIGLFFAAPSLVIVLYGDKWQPTILPLQIMCISGLFNVFTMIFTPVLLAKNLVKNRARRQFFYLIVLASAIWYGLRWGIVGVAWGVAISSVVFLGLIVHLVSRHLPFSIWHFIKAQKASLLYGLIQGGSLWLLWKFSKPYFAVDSWQMLLSVIFVSIFTVIGSHLIFRFKEVDEFFGEVFVGVKKFWQKIMTLTKPAVTPESGENKP